MALHLAARYPDAVTALVVVNPYVRDRRLVAAGAVKVFVRSVAGRANDINKPDQDELAYDRLPVAGLAQADRFLKVVRKELPRVRQPLLLFRSPEDHVVPAGSSAQVLDGVASEDKELLELPNSYHVATMDHDAELIFERAHDLAEANVTAPDAS
jgi:carboxylesterase